MVVKTGSLNFDFKALLDIAQLSDNECDVAGLEYGVGRRDKNLVAALYRDDIDFEFFEEWNLTEYK